MSLVLNTKKFVPSIQQSLVFDWITNGSGSGVICAVAGSGKTTTLVKALGFMIGSIFFGAYNKKIAEEIKARAGSRDNLNVSTMHAAGFAAWRGAVKTSKVDGDKVRNIFREACFRNIQYSQFIQTVVQLVSLAKQSGFGCGADFPAMKSRSAWQGLIDYFDVETFDEKTDVDNTDIIIKLSIKTLESSIQQNMSIIDFDDMIYAPLFHGCSFTKYNWVLLDEAQDTNMTRRVLALKMLKPNGRLIAVGDPRQAIYQFQGASSDAMDLIGSAVQAKYFDLSISYRCPKAVVKYAQKWVSHIHSSDTAIEGVVRTIGTDTLHLEAKPGDAILCRYNAPLILQVYKFISTGIPAKIEGREIGVGLKTLVNKWKVKSITALLDRLVAHEEREEKKFIAKDQLQKIPALQDKCMCIKVIVNRVLLKNPETKTPAADVCEEIDSIFGDNNTDSVVLLSSIHRSKGREWKKVLWIQTPANKRAKLDWQLLAEDNLNYVATTRAMEELILVDMIKEAK